MKLQTIMVLVAVSLAIFASGCRYNKARSSAGAGSEGQEVAGGDIAGISSQVDDTNIESGSLDSLSGKSFKDRGYTLCTDVNFAPVYFQFDSTVIAQSELSKVDEVVSHLNSKADRVVVVEGNCDERGSNEYNMSLGENRAIIIRNYLVQNGIAADRIQTRSYGEERPAATGSGESVWSLNRRGEFAIFQK